MDFINFGGGSSNSRAVGRGKYSVMVTKLANMRYIAVAVKLRHCTVTLCMVVRTCSVVINFDVHICGCFMNLQFIKIPEQSFVGNDLEVAERNSKGMV